ncbi:DUF1697 domain-containing protein [Paenibacillus sp. NFR01]|uniref:DUF1697 domain-containing protein n=1 Tax=Paenibacillus sp. NFR01 TaxID=1566279 RepID=UPI0008D8BE9E|nr:DUF1697 domain-containing protein [Paenibacillus sp. NFR01]SEU29461.1 Uncharacterized conserved protein, DUF1697 family [Paenibacillus sp. NFR01]
MTTYIALLRGINVGGNRIIRMAELKTMCESLGLEKVRTYIQSGNIVFGSAAEAGELERLLHRSIEETFGFPVDVMVRSLEELEAVIAGNPFPLTTAEEFKRLYVTFLKEEPKKEGLEKVAQIADGADKMIMKGRTMYTLYEISVSKSKLFQMPLDKWLGTTLTARNWATTGKLAELGRGL